ncbi:hypothetical protein MNBD_BACTEROID07-1933 [hydrothermal vent metagenome]|uniref:Uncharacterized protein n=1 Tax=hydrothermal vent metagenome TaxID=652676 RepID=A0A3B0V6S8_9ZZZZ
MLHGCPEKVRKTGKVDDAFGDRNLCACLPVSEYEGPVVKVGEM